jgi:hypothetical protein
VHNTRRLPIGRPSEMSQLRRLAFVFTVALGGWQINAMRTVVRATAARRLGLENLLFFQNDSLQAARVELSGVVSAPCSPRQSSPMAAARPHEFVLCVAADAPTVVSEI